MNDIKNEVLRGIWEDRYRKNGETLEENFQRLAKYSWLRMQEFLVR